ncbi:hypothetical protein GGR54DRAFT_638680 [Hypoxylon sp. NC1633]|nr:hypothetical protein GGR54DRAFT_638680 [Hypoxylon sp. NC1633]
MVHNVPDHQPIPEPRDYYDNPPAVVLERTPHDQRANPLINGNDPEFLQIKEYFLSLLRNTRLTIDEILNGLFEPGEINIFKPASHPPELIETQKSNSVRYEELLKTRFEGHTSSLHLKLTFLYFGLPVAPMLPGGVKIQRPFDLDNHEDVLAVQLDNMKFLEAYGKRTYGDPEKRVFDDEFPEVIPTQTFTSTTLRGGALPPVFGPSDQDSKAVWICGYQGRLQTHLRYEDFVATVDQLLGALHNYNYSICFEIWDTSTGQTEVVDSVTGVVYHGDFVPRPDDPLVSLVQRWFLQTEETDRYVGFVHFDKEEHPPAYAPYSGDRHIVRLWDNDGKMAYMRVPENLQSSHKPNQFAEEYSRVMYVLYPKLAHQFLDFSDLTQEKGLAYGYHNPPPGVWDEIVAQADRDPMLLFTEISIPINYVPVLVPGFYNYSVNFEASKTTGKLSKEDLIHDKTDNDRDGLSRFLYAVGVAGPSKTSTRVRVGLDVWFPGEDFLDVTNGPTRVSVLGDDNTPQTILDWRLLVHNYTYRRHDAEERPTSIVARPVWDDYEIHVKGHADRHFILNVGKVTLNQFMVAVKQNLYAGYEVQNDDVLHIAQSTWRANRVDFVVKRDTTEAEWAWMVRHITEPNLEVSIESWNSDWDVDKKWRWGPRYERTSLGVRELTTRYYLPGKPAPFSEPIEKLFKRSGNNKDGANRAQKLRERYFWDNPSIFTNPAKPAFSIHAPPLESIIMTGPNVPGFTTAMRTPSEVARLEREVHRLRGTLLDRVRECPYVHCEQYFAYKDAKGLDRHLREDHKTMQCFLCTREKHLFPYYNTTNIRSHFLDVHYDDLKEHFTGSRTHPGATRAKFCNLCGRDQEQLYNPKDRSHHDRLCKVGQNVLTTWCIHCGRALKLSELRCACDEFTNDFCETCGLHYDNNMNAAYRERHLICCRPPGGLANDVCYICGIILADKDDAEKSRHVHSCQRSTSVPYRPGPEGVHELSDIGSVVDGGSSRSNPIEDLLNALNQEPQHTHKTGGDPVDIDPVDIDPDDIDPDDIDPDDIDPDDTDLFDTDIVETESESHDSQTQTPEFRRIVLWRGATESDPIPRQRPTSPVWEDILEDSYPPFGFSTSPEARCSRCFRCAGYTLEGIEAHSDPNGSCRIRRGFGSLDDNVPMPNRSGWIPPSIQHGFNFRAAYYAFIRRYPAYRHTMFPVRPESVHNVWEEPFDLAFAIGSDKDDPNHRGRLQAFARIRELPWPPYEGLVIPLDTSSSDSSDNGGGGGGGPPDDDNHNDDGGGPGPPILTPTPPATADPVPQPESPNKRKRDPPSDKGLGNTESAKKSSPNKKSKKSSSVEPSPAVVNIIPPNDREAVEESGRGDKPRGGSRYIPFKVPASAYSPNRRRHYPMWDPKTGKAKYEKKDDKNNDKKSGDTPTDSPSGKNPKDPKNPSIRGGSLEPPAAVDSAAEESEGPSTRSRTRAQAQAQAQAEAQQTASTPEETMQKSGHESPPKE